MNRSLKAIKPGDQESEHGVKNDVGKKPNDDFEKAALGFFGFFFIAASSKILGASDSNAGCSKNGDTDGHNIN